MRTRTIAQISGMLVVFFLMIRQLVILKWKLGIIVVVLPYLIINTLEIYFLSVSLCKKPKFMDAAPLSLFISLAVTAHPAVVSMLFNNTHHIVQLWVFGMEMNFAAALFIIWALLSLRNNLTLLPEANTLVAKGPYKITRHPLYLAYMVLAIDEMAMYQTLAVIALAFIQIAFILIRASREEALLLDKMPGYREYRKKVMWFDLARYWQ